MDMFLKTLAVVGLLLATPAVAEPIGTVQTSAFCNSLSQIRTLDQADTLVYKSNYGRL